MCSFSPSNSSSLSRLALSRPHSQPCSSFTVHLASQHLDVTCIGQQTSLVIPTVTHLLKLHIVCSTCPLDFHRPPSVNSVPLSPLHKGTIVSAPSPLLFRTLRMTCLCVVLGNPQRHSTNSLLPLSRHIVAEVICYNSDQITVAKKYP